MRGSNATTHNHAAPPSLAVVAAAVAAAAPSPSGHSRRGRPRLTVDYAEDNAAAEEEESTRVKKKRRTTCGSDSTQDKQQRQKQREKAGAEGAAAAATTDNGAGPAGGAEEEHKSASRQKRRAAGAPRLRGMAALVAAASAAASTASAEAAAAAAAADSGGIEDFESLLNDLAWAANGAGSAAAGGAGMTMNLEDAHLFAGGGARLPVRSSDSSKVAQCGILKRMTLKNWLNHKRFDIQFNPNVNFISGKNGTGKSSILHAIQVVFGSRASDTSRGSKLADLIHHGREEAVIEVLVKNEGDGAFKHEQYGDTIAIVKKIRRNGAGITRVLNHATGAEVSRSPSEVAELCAHFNILVSNPCVIMTQEVSKKFLQSKKAEDKYTFFLQATQLEWLRASLADSKHQIEQMDHTVAPLGERILELVKDMQDLHRQEALAQEADSLQDDIDHLLILRAWCEVLDGEILFDQKEHARNEAEQDTKKMMAKRDKLAASFSGAEALAAAKQTHGEAIERESVRMRELGSQAVERDAAVIKVKREQKSVHMRIDQLKKRIADRVKRRAANERKIKEIAAANTSDTSAADAKLQQEEDKLKAERKALDAALQKLKAELGKVNQKEMEQRTELSDLERGVREANQRLQQAVPKLNSVSDFPRVGAGGVAAAATGAASAANHNPALGYQTARIWAEIKKAKWQVQPIGPLGEYVQIPAEHEKWLKGVTECLTRKHMATYVVDNFHDQQQLRSILNRVWQVTGDISLQPVVLKLTRTPRYAVKPPAVGRPLVLNCLQIKDAWAFNALIFLCKPDRFALCDNLADAKFFLRAHRSRVAYGVSPIRSVFLPDGGKVSLLGAGTETSERRNEQDLFRVSQAEKLRKLESVVTSTKADFKSLQSLAWKKRDEVTSVTKEMHRLKMEGRTLMGRINANEDANAELARVADERVLQQLQLVDEDDSQYVQDNIDALNEQHEFEGQVEKLRQHDHRKYAKRIAALEKERNALQAQCAECEAAIDAQQKTLSAVVVHWSIDERKLRKYTTLSDNLLQKLCDLDADLAAHAGRLEEIEERALKYASNRPPAAELASTCKQLAALTRFKEETLKEKRRSAPVDLTEVKLQYQRKKLKKVETEAGMAKVIANVQSMKDANHARVLKMVAYRKTLADAASYVFNSLLEMSGGSGRLDFDAERRTLQLIVNPNTADAERADAIDTIALSGGERSTTTIAFVMAVGESVNTPFRAFDEFDVFMDAVNRGTALRALLSIGAGRRDRQFFFLSPLDVSSIQTTPFLSVHRLADPQRGQSTLDEHTTVDGDL